MIALAAVLKEPTQVAFPRPENTDRQKLRDCAKCSLVRRSGSLLALRFRIQRCTRSRTNDELKMGPESSVVRVAKTELHESMIVRIAEFSRSSVPCVQKILPSGLIKFVNSGKGDDVLFTMRRGS